ncbi:MULTISPECIES: hypothetical protein [Sphingobacterium]|uniref:hypothetical protein n=1 Tax=Sphingobacterium TaxID=28453 RepID=UPI00257F5F04|nr:MULTISPECIES: hypothetical protein [Sphingobacterium]
MKTLIAQKTAKKRVSLIEQTRILNNSQISEICDILGWTELQYCEHQFEQYEQFLKRVLHGNSWSFLSKIRHSPLMRGLWNNEWIRRNDEFIKSARYLLFSGFEVDEEGVLYQVLPPDEATEARVFDDYHTLHNGKLLAVNHEFIERFEHVIELIFSK